MFSRSLFIVVLFSISKRNQGQHKKVLSKWNKNENIKYGIILHPSRLGYDEAGKLCKRKHFHNIMTVRSRQELTNVANTIWNYRRSQIPKDTVYWLGSTRDSPTSQWRYYDRKPLTYANWDRDYPKQLPKYSCSVGQFKCSGSVRNCTLVRRNRDCKNTKGISRTFCERRGNRIRIENVEDKLKKILDHESPRNYSKMIARNLYVATMQADLSDDVVRKGINILKNLTEENRDFSIPEEMMEDIIKLVGAYQDFAFKNNSNFNAEKRQSVVKYLEILMNNLEISENKTVTKFNTSSILAEIHYLDPNAEPKAYVFSFNQPGSEHVSLTVSSEAVGRLQGKVGVGKKSRLSFIKFLSSNLFSSKFNSSQVLSAQINGQTISGLASPITYLIPPDRSSSSKNIPFVQCVAWDFNTSSWSNRGCWLQTRNLTPVCACNHMTNFALLVEWFQRPSEAIFDSINLIFGSLSCVGFFLTAIIYINFEKLRNSKPGPIHINLCCCYAIAYIIFLSGSNNRSNSLTCLTVAILSHYFFLVSWFWTFIEAFTLYQLIVKKSSYLDEKYYARVSLFAYFIPLIVVLTNVGIALGYEDRKPKNGFSRLNDNLLYNSSYVSNYVCWLTSYSLYFGFLTIGGILMILNFIIYIIVVRAITCSRRKIHSTRKNSSIKTFYQVVTIGLLTGLIWILAIPMELLAMFPALVKPVTYSFSFLIGVQGVLIFYLLCVHHRRARHCWFNPPWRLFKKYLLFLFCFKDMFADRFRGNQRYSMESKAVENADMAVTVVAYSSQNYSLNLKEKSIDEKEKIPK